MIESSLFNREERGGKVIVSPDYNERMEQHREIRVRRILYLIEKGVFQELLFDPSSEAEHKNFALLEACRIYNYSFSKLVVYVLLWGSALKFFGTKRHHEKWLKGTKDYLVMDFCND